MDFITSLPESKGNNVIIVFIDRLTKYAHFCAVSHIFSASSIVVEFMNIVHKLHGNPNIIVSDRDPIFMRKYWIELFSCLGT